MVKYTTFRWLCPTYVRRLCTIVVHFLAYFLKRGTFAWSYATFR